jgi:Arc/MetJ-type ribon-helix-helix transcriptional regulator
MKALTVRLPDEIVAEIESESVARRMSKSDVVRERLSSQRVKRSTRGFASIADLVGSVDGLPEDLSDTKRQLAILGYGRKHPR